MLNTNGSLAGEFGNHQTEPDYTYFIIPVKALCCPDCISPHPRKRVLNSFFIHKGLKALDSSPLSFCWNDRKT